MSNLSDRLAAALGDRYHLKRELGQGGMATVYLAQDSRHGRPVAIKVLRPELAAVIGTERFLAEIRTTAALQHPHILPLFDSGSFSEYEGGAPLRPYYVMPLVEGESLRDRLTREKQLPIADAVRIASEVASALDYAHRHGIIHRDIKPENILLHDGQALVADFGIALAASNAGGHRLTETGLSLGTPHYMSPEQAMGERDITARSDVYALGCVTYEMLVGEPPFSGPTPQAIIAKVMTSEPAPPSAQRKTIPPALEEAVLTALQKLPADRYGTAAEFAAALMGTGSASRRPDALRTGGQVAESLSPRAALYAAIGITAIIAAWGRLRPTPAAVPLRFERSTKVTSDPGLEVQPAISPDGRLVAYAAGSSTDLRVFVRPVAGGRQNAASDDSTDASSMPRWSPDGTRILFLSRGAVFSAPASGGPARQEVPARNGSPVRFADWAPDGARLAYVVADSLFIRDADGGVRPLARIEAPNFCTWSPGGAEIACSAGNDLFLSIGPHYGNLSPSRVVVCRVADGTITPVTDGTWLNQAPVWSPDGRWLYFISNREGPRDIFALRVRGGLPGGAPIRLTVGLGAQSISVSRDGHQLAYALYNATSNIWSLPIPTGAPISVRQATPVTHGNQIVENARASRDGRWLTYDSDLNGSADIYRLPVDGGEPERLTTDPIDEFFPDLSPDGREVAYHSWRSGSRDIYVMPLDGGPRQQVTSSPRQEAAPVWSPDGGALAYSEATSGGAIWITRRAPDRSWQAPVVRLNYGASPVWSPDGRQLAFTSALLGGVLGIMPADSGPVRVLVDPARGGAPIAEAPYWSGDGRTIYYKSHDPHGVASFWSVPAAGGISRQVVRFDDPSRPSYRISWALGSQRIYFMIDDRQSDLWVVQVSPQ